MLGDLNGPLSFPSSTSVGITGIVLLRHCKAVVEIYTTIFDGATSCTMVVYISFGLPGHSHLHTQTEQTNTYSLPQKLEFNACGRLLFLLL